MPRVRLDGGVIGSLNTPTTSLASGIWTIKDNEEYTRRGLWPSQSYAVGSINAIALVVAGGGGGGYYWGGGGGAGGLVYSNNLIINTGVNYPIVIGAGGTGSSAYSVRGSNGSSSSFSNIATVGGGGGGSWNGASSYPQSTIPFIGVAGGSGGGASSKGNAGGANTLGQGYAGGAGSSDNNTYDSAGGGGGAGAVGATATGGTGVAGGAGASYNFANGTSVAYAGGGGGGSTGSGGAGGTGGGGAGGGNNNQSGTSGTAGLGGGGGGGSGSTSVSGNTGGSGVVIVSYPLPQQWTGGIVTNNNGANVIHTFTTSGTMTALSTPIDTYQPYNTILLHADGTSGANNSVFLDSSGVNTITRQGSTTQGTFSPFSTTGWSNYYPTTSDYTYFTDASAGVFGTGDFTVECWIFGVTDPGSGSGYNIIFPNTTTNTWGLLTYNYQLIWHQQGSNSPSGGNVPVGKWTHLAAVRISSVTTIYINGINVGSAADTTNYSSTTSTLSFGPGGGGTAGFYLSNARIIKGTGIYTGNFTPPTAPLTAVSNTTILTNQSNRFIDNSSSPVSFTISGSPQIQPFSPFNPTAAYSNTVVGGSIYYNGSTDYLVAPLSNTLDWGASANWTFETWIYPLSRSVQGDILARRTTGVTTDWSIYQSTSGNFVIYNYTGGTTITSSSVLPLNAWSHVAVSIVNGTATIYVNGIANSSPTAISAAATGQADTGYYIGGGPNYPNWYLSNMRVVNGTALYTSNFTPSSVPLTAITNTKLLLNATNAGIIDSSQKNNLTTYGSAAISTTQSKFGGSSILFNGSTDYLTFNNSIVMGTQAYTMECWFYLNSTSFSPNFYPFIGTSTNSTSALNIRIASTTVIRVDANGSSGTNFTLPVTLTTGVWYHVAVTRDSAGNCNVWLNGIVSTTGNQTISTNYTGTTDTIGYVNGSPNAFFNGYIDEFRLTRGYARYTANFTPPTTAFLNT